MNFRFHNHFKKSYLNLSKKMQKSVDDRLLMFSKDPFDILLKNHSLSGRYKNYHSINITGNYRAIYKNISKDYVIFIKLGTHSQLY